MNKTELTEAILAKNPDLTSKAQAGRVVDSFFETIKEELAKGGDLQVIGFGTFSVANKAARKGKNPKTGEEIKIAACKAPKFKAGKALKDAVNTPAKKSKKK